MLSTWLKRTDAGITTTSADTLTLALHVLTSAGFGQSYAFESGTQAIPAGHKLSYRASLLTLLKNFPILIAFRHDLLTKSYMPQIIQSVGLAVKEFRQYMEEMIESEREKMALRASGAKPDIESENLVTSLIRASEEGKSTNYSLSDDEIMGNLFIYNLAGHETTANTLAYAITLISIRPKYQDWLHEELRRVLDKAGPAETWKYEDIFPQLTRCLATMYETLRLYGPVPELKRCVQGTPQPLNIAGKQHIVPPDTFVVPNLIAVQTDKRYWGEDCLEWKPDRWIEKRAGDSGSEESRKPPPVKGWYTP